MIPSGTRFIGIADSVDLTERKSAGLNAETQPYTIEDIKGYKVFTALLTQSGESVEDRISSGELVIGVTYQITDWDNAANFDFTNVGAPNNEFGTYFVATGTIPNSWGTGEVRLIFNTGAPVVNVLENTIGNVWFTYDDVGLYSVKSDELFINNKTICSLSNSLFGGSADFNSNLIFYSSVAANNEIFIISSSGGTYSNDQLSNTPIEIRVYN
jgi:hypothetical protein